MEQLIYAEQARDLKKLGFPFEVKLLEEAPPDWKGKAFFTGMATCAKLPSIESVREWLAEKKNINIKISDNTIKYWYTIYYIKPIKSSHRYDTYEEALLTGIDKAIEILNKK